LRRFRFGTIIAIEWGSPGARFLFVFGLSVDLYKFFVFHIVFICYKPRIDEARRFSERGALIKIEKEGDAAFNYSPRGFF
jgi:hypothetical protein